MIKVINKYYHEIENFTELMEFVSYMSALDIEKTLGIKGGKFEELSFQFRDDGMRVLAYDEDEGYMKDIMMWFVGRQAWLKSKYVPVIFTKNIGYNRWKKIMNKLVGYWNTGVNEGMINPEKNSEFDEHETSTDVIGGLIEKRNEYEGEKVGNFGYGSLGFNGKDMIDILEVWKKIN